MLKKQTQLLGTPWGKCLHCCCVFFWRQSCSWSGVSFHWGSRK